MIVICIVIGKGLSFRKGGQQAAEKITTVATAPEQLAVAAAKLNPTDEGPLAAETMELNLLSDTAKDLLPAPAAVPVVTPEEAEKLNVFAIFFRRVKATTVEGEIIERSELPDPKKSDYPNCRFTVHFKGNSIKSGEPCPKELSLIVEGFENYCILPSNDIKTGDKVICSIIPFEQLPEDYQSTQQADDLELFLLESYYVLDISVVGKYTDDELMPVSGIFFSDGNKDYVSLFERHINPPISETIEKAQDASISKDLKKMKDLLAEYDDEKIESVNHHFAEVWDKEKAKDPPGYNRVGNYVWRNREKSFWTLPAETSSILEKPDVMSQQMLDCFLSLKQVLEANGVQLIVSLVPYMNVISARVVNQEFKDVPDLQTATYVKQLSEIGIETIYASDQIINNYNRFPFAYFFPDNPHPSDTVQDVIADILAERIQRYEIKQELDPTLFSEAQRPHLYKDDVAYLFPRNCDIGDNIEKKAYTCRDILYNGERTKRSKDSSIMVIGNSYMETPISTPESAPALLSYKLSSPIDWYRISGYGPFSDILIQFLSNLDFFIKGKKVLVFYVGTTALTNVNNSGIMLDIAQLDNQRVLLNNKRQTTHFKLVSNTEPSYNYNEKIWGPLFSIEKTVHRIDESGELTFNYMIAPQEGTDETKSIVCVIPATCRPNATCKLLVNGQEKHIPSSNWVETSRFFNLVYELPAGTKEISIKAEGKINTIFAIKDIQLWQ